MMLAILLWGFVYSSHVNHDDTSKGLTIKVTHLKNYLFFVGNRNNLNDFQEFMSGNKQSGLLTRLGVNGREINFNNEPIRFFKPTVSNNLYSIGRKGNLSGKTCRGKKVFSLELSLFRLS